MSEGYFSTNQLCERYDCSKRNIYHWRKNMGFPAPVYSRGFSLYLREDVYAWERENLLKKEEAA